MKVDAKEITTEKQQVGKAVVAAKAVKIASAEDMTKATDVLGKVKKLAKIVEAKKKAITAPMNEALKEVRAMFAPLEAELAEAERIIKGEMVTYSNKVEAAARAEEAKIAKKVEAGTMKFETGQKKMEAIAQPENKVQGKSAAVNFRITKVPMVFDKMALIRAVAEGGIVTDLLEVNATVLRDLVLKQGLQIPGVRVDERKDVAGTAAL